MTQGTTVIFDHFARFGLEMHLGTRKMGRSNHRRLIGFFSPLENGTKTQAEMTIASKRPTESEEQICQGRTRATTELMRHN